MLNNLPYFYPENNFIALNKRKDILLLKTSLIFLGLVLGAAVSFGQTLRVAVAANAQFVCGALKNAFEKRYPIKIETIVSSSGKLTAQTEHGAPYDIFLSADMKYPQALYQAGNTLNRPQAYAYGKLVLWTLRPIDLKNELSVLKSGSIKTIAIANPASAPYGVAAVQAMKQAGIYGEIESKIVYGESIAQVNQYLLSGVADVAFTAKSVVLSPALKNEGKWIEVPDHFYQPVEQGVVILKHARENNLKAAQAFYQFLFSAQGKAIFESFGYKVK